MVRRLRERVPGEVPEVPSFAAEDIADPGLETGIAAIEHLGEEVGQSRGVLLRQSRRDQRGDVVLHRQLPLRDDASRCAAALAGELPKPAQAPRGELVSGP